MLWLLLLFFINEEYLIALVDLIAPCGGTKGQRRRTLRIPPSLSSGLQLFHRTTQAWFRDPLRRVITADREGLYQYSLCRSG